MSTIIKLIASSVDFVVDIIFVVLEINSIFMESLMKYTIYICKLLFCFALRIYDGIRLAAGDLITFLLEFGHGVLIILDIVLNCMLCVLNVISQAYEILFRVMFAMYSFTSSFTKCLVKQSILLTETLRNFAVLIISSCALFLQAIPVFVTMVLKGSLTLIMRVTESIINSISSGIKCIYDSLHCFTIKMYATICDTSTDVYIGTFFLFITYFISKKMWQTYRRNGPPQCILLLTRSFINMICGLITKFHLCGQRMFSLFSFSTINEDNSDVLNINDSTGMEDGVSDTTPNHLEEASASTSYLHRKPLISLRNGITNTESDKEMCELSTRILEAELEKERDRHMCIVCQDKPKNIIILPCRHLCMCSECYRNILISTNVCPLCRQEIYDSMYVFF